MTDRDKAVDALDDLEKVFGEGLTPHGWEMFDTIRQALTPQSSADLESLEQAIEDLDYYIEQSGTLAHNQTWKDKFKNIRNVLYAQGRTHVPEGWKLVPIKATEEIYKAWESVDEMYREAGEEGTSIIGHGYYHWQKMVEAAAPPVTGSAWQPIDSAPEGKDILVYCQETGECFVVFWALQVDTRKGDWVIARADDGTCFICKKPTHWMPLPAPPSSQTRGG